MALVDELICEFISNIKMKNFKRCDQVFEKILKEKRHQRLDTIAKSLIR